ncbi:rCG20318 [Rattus norvegicus]|uniref:RCG20318 n=1 Tax=Rattus norvegicus TaxID=10116 RepID=A6JGN9_RAT|nr:rCG20318 [Rattus norvegicus]
MSLPLRLPYCSPARRLRAVLLFPYFCAPVTPPPSPVCSQEPDSEPESCTPENYTEEDAWLCAGSQWGPVLSGSVGAVPQSWAWPGPPNFSSNPSAPAPTSSSHPSLSVLLGRLPCRVVLEPAIHPSPGAGPPPAPSGAGPSASQGAPGWNSKRWREGAGARGVQPE